MLQVRAKFKCSFKKDDYVSFSPVYSGSAENEQFFKATPGGEIRLHVVNANAMAEFEEGVHAGRIVNYPRPLPARRKRRGAVRRRVKRDKHERKHRLTDRHPDAVAMMANADFSVVPSLAEAMGFDQSYEANRASFVKRLVESAGWSREDAEQEWEKTQRGEYDD